MISSSEVRLCLLVAIFVPLAYTYVANAPYPTFAKCDPKVISAIKEFWQTHGQPQNVLKQLEESGLFTVYYTSYSYKNSDNKCAYLNTSNGIMEVSFLHKNGDTAKMVYNVREGNDSVLTGEAIHTDAKEHTWNWYQISLKNGVSVHYVCGSHEGSSERPLVGIKVAEHNINEHTNTSINHAFTLLNKEGLNMTYTYGLECTLKQ